MRAFDFAVLWGDLAVSLLVMVAGTLLVPGLGTQQALLAIVVGTVLGTVLLALAGMIGSDTGVPTMVACGRRSGIRGSYCGGGSTSCSSSGGRRWRSSSWRRPRGR